MPVEGTFRAHQVPLAELADESRAPRPSSSTGCAATGPRSCSTRTARPVAELLALAPEGERRMGANPHANGGLLLRDLDLPDFRDYAVEVPSPASASWRGDARRWAGSCATSCACNADEHNFRVFGPDETQLQPARRGLRGHRPRAWAASDRPDDEHLAPDGRVMEVLSEHMCQGWLEGYLLTGRHGLFSCYEAFIHIVDSMFNQHAKWLKVTRDDPLAAPDRLAELPAHLARLAAGPQRLLAPGPGLHRPRRQQEGRGRPRLPAARRQHPALGRRPLPAQPDYVNVIVAGKQPAPQWLTIDARHRALHARASASGSGPATTTAASPTSCMACAGDVPTLETARRGRAAARASSRPGFAWSTWST